jgi:hypothetical protein
LAVTVKKDNDSSVIGHDWFKVLFICDDAISSYDNFFTKRNHGLRPPVVVLIEDYGMGGNYDRFGKGGYLEKIILGQAEKPPYIICRAGVPAWTGYKKVEGVMSEYGGMHNYERMLYKLIIE